LRVTYLEQCEPALPPALYWGSERVARERMTREPYLALYRRVCEFDRSVFPQIELKNFGLVPDAQGRGLGPWLLATALQGEWRSNPDRIWLHTDTWDHPAAQRVYERAGFRVFDVRDEPAEPL
jgi:GNAT superfamily N-acetyltransferase